MPWGPLSYHGAETSRPQSTYAGFLFRLWINPRSVPLNRNTAAPKKTKESIVGSTQALLSGFLVYQNLQIHAFGHRDLEKVPTLLCFFEAAPTTFATSTSDHSNVGVSENWGAWFKGFIELHRENDVGHRRILL